MQNLLNNQVLFHPITVATYLAAVAAASHHFWGDYGRLLVALSGISIAWLSMVGRLNEAEVSKAEHMEIEEYFDKEVLTTALGKSKSSGSEEDAKKGKKNQDKKVVVTAADAPGGKFYTFAYVYDKLVVSIISARVQPSSDAGKREVKLFGLVHAQALPQHGPGRRSADARAQDHPGGGGAKGRLGDGGGDGRDGLGPRRGGEAAAQRWVCADAHDQAARPARQSLRH